MSTSGDTARNELISRGESQSEAIRGRRAFPLAVIELGTSAIRMSIGESDGGSEVRVLEQLVRGVSLGKDTFTVGEIQRKTLQECIRVLKSYRRKLREYQCSDPKYIRVIATSAVREATNRLEVLDRIYIATGLAVELIDDAEIARLTYLGVRPLLQEEAVRENRATLVVEVGGGNTEAIVLRGKDIMHAQPWRLGSLRLQQLLLQSEASRRDSESLLTGQIDRTLEPLVELIPRNQPPQIVSLGGDMRLAARLVNHGPRGNGFTQLAVRELRRLTERLLPMPVDAVMHKYHIELSQAETLVPALLSNLRLAELLNVDHLLVTGFNIRDALLQGMIRPNDWSADFREQIVNSAMELARKYQVDLPHALHVAGFAKRLFTALLTEHRMDARCETLLYTAALLHATGLFVGLSGYHKHSYYLIMNSELFGLNSLDHQLVALIARYHRRAAPKPTHEYFARLDRDSRVIVSRLAAILRVAVALDHSGTQRIGSIDCSLERNRLVLTATKVAGDLSLERMELRQKSGLFEDTFGMGVLLREPNGK
ncbi:MAG: Exopolyphosphatase [Planctomycetota bacterium]|jgi:exopolyphosphatase/guanosine-5'-triphosphate,3'-diphosphate pyrophosphatase